MEKKRNKKAQAIGMEAARELGSTGEGIIHSDVLGSYTGLALRGEPFEPLDMVYLDEDDVPVQDADDL